MLDLSLVEVEKAIEATRIGPTESVPACFPEVSIDSRTIQPGQAFFCIKGVRHDGHKFISAALERGAAVIVVSDRSEGTNSVDDCIFLQVEDTTRALQQLSALVRSRWGGPIVAITGSMGKTTTKHFIAAVTGAGRTVHQTPGNFNNEFGLPLSLLALESHHQLAILELGMNHAGEIRRLGQICSPNYAVLTNVAPVHLEFFEDLNGIAEAKGEILETLQEPATLFYNIDDPLIRKLALRHRAESVSFGFDESAEYRVASYAAENLESTQVTITGAQEVLELVVPFSGRHVLYNLVAAVAVASKLGMTPESIRRSMAGLHLLPMRGQAKKLRGFTLWDDSYNSNPAAVASVLETIRDLSSYSRKIIVLADMLELGRKTEELHYGVGTKVAECRPDLLITVGEASLHIGRGAIDQGLPTNSTRHFDDAVSAAEYLEQTLRPGDLLLVKGSRGMQLDRIVRKLEGDPS